MTSQAAHADAPEAISLRARPRPVTRLNRTALMVILGGIMIVIFGALMIALQPPSITGDGERTELYNTRNKPHAEGLAALPQSYEGMQSTLGPPMPGDLGAAILRAQNELGVQPAPPALPSAAPFRPSAEDEAVRNEALRQAKMAVEARESQVFFKLNNRPAVGERTAAEGTAPAAAGPATIDLVTRDETALGPTLAEDPNRQARKLSFLDETVDADIYNPHAIQDPVSPYQVLAGTIIPASLMTGINSDLPGQVIAQVTQPVYDTVTGQHMLIPQGSRVIGRYDSVVAFGQSRALVVWDRIIMPDGSSIVIENLPATDTRGYAGLEDEVDFHTWRLLQGIILSTLLGVSTELTFDEAESEIVAALRESAQSSANQAGQRIVNRALNIQPTITVRPGWPLRIIVNKDLVLRPYQG